MFVSATSPIVLYVYKFAFKSFLLPLVLLSGRQKWRLVSKASENRMSLSYTKNQFAKFTYTRQYLPNIVLETVPFIWFYKWSSAKPNGHMYGKSPNKTYACRFYSHFYKKKAYLKQFFLSDTAFISNTKHDYINTVMCWWFFTVSERSVPILQR